jgi:hypothetical protein
VVVCLSKALLLLVVMLSTITVTGVIRGPGA